MVQLSARYKVHHCTGGSICHNLESNLYAMVRIALAANEAI